MTEQRILVVDDDDAIRALLFTVLRRRGFKVDAARNGVEALDRCARCRYAVLLLDLMMPRKSGYEVLREMALFPVDARPIVVVLTAGNEPRDLDPRLVAGIIRKPFDVSLLIDTIRGCLTTVGTSEQSEGCPPAQSDSRPSNASNRDTN